VKVLLVEDERSLASVLARNLRARGYDVDLADTAEEAILSMAERWPDALIVDVNLPDFSGWEILRRLSEEDRSRLKVIMTSAAPLSQKRISEFRPAHALQKPFPIEAMLHALQDEGSTQAGPQVRPALSGQDAKEDA
jgi:DNA-binding response OmpR family regulator